MVAKKSSDNVNSDCINPNYSLMKAHAEQNVLLIAKFESAMKAGKRVRIV